MVSFRFEHNFIWFDIFRRTFSHLATLMGQKKDFSTLFCAETLYASVAYCVVSAHRTCLNPKFKKIANTARLARGFEHLGFRKTRAKRPLSKKGFWR
jgi:hypothetical protein